MNVLEQRVRPGRADNPRVPADTIAVQAFGGDVILRGTVGSLVQREEAVRTARHVAGETSVADRLKVRLLDANRRADADTEVAVLDALNVDEAVRAADIDVAVREGRVTLSGLVDLSSQRDRAERIARAVPGVSEVRDRLRVALRVSAD